MKKIISLFMAVAVAFCYVAPANLAVAEATNDHNEKEQISILFTHDMHSHLDSKNIVLDGKKQDIGGFARIKTVKDQIEEKYPETLLVDAGDFAMGTAFQTIYKKQAPELVTMGKIGYDATVLGNHEFDYSAKATAEMLNSAVREAGGRENLPAMTGLNIDWNKTLKDKDTKTNGQALKDAFQNYGVEDYKVVEKNGVKIAIFGLIGDDAIQYSGNAKIHFSNYIERAKQIVGEIMRNDEADYIVCLSHGGTGDKEEDYENSDDVRLAKEVKGIDLIISGHSHTTFEEPKKVGDTVLVCCGEYNHNIGHVVLEKTQDKFQVADYKLIPLNKNIKKDSAIQATVDSYKPLINSEYFSDYGYSYDQVLANNSVEFTQIEDFGEEQKEDNLANLIADSYVYTVDQMEKNKETAKSNKDPVTVSVVPAGTVRDSFAKGPITVSDVFDVNSLGVGKDGKAGYPVVSVYLTGKEIKNIAEIDASVSPNMKSARLYTSGLSYNINKHRMPLNKAYNVKLQDENNKITKLENKKLYRVVGGLFTCQSLNLVKDKSHSLLSIEPKDKDGKVIENLEDAVIKDKKGNELKEWYVLANYIDSFDNDKIPSYYEKNHNRKIVENTFNPVKILKNPNHIAIMIYAIALIPIVIIVGIIVAIIRSRQRRRGYKKSIFSGSKNRSYNRTMGSRGRRPNVKRHPMSMSGRKRRPGRRRRY